MYKLSSYPSVDIIIMNIDTNKNLKHCDADFIVILYDRLRIEYTVDFD